MSKSQQRRELRKRREIWPTWYPGKKPRLYLDADLPSGFVDNLKEFGVDAIHPEQLATQCRDDSFHWHEAHRLKRVLVTCNRKDFWNDHRFPLKDSQGVVVIDAGGVQDWQHVGVLLFNFIRRLKDLVQGPGGGRIVTASKIRLTRDKISWKYVAADSRVETENEEWGPWW